jgi:hypothetical protein
MKKMLKLVLINYASRWNWIRKIRSSNKKKPQTGDKIVILGGENYRIGMGGAAVSSQIQALLVQVLRVKRPTFKSRNAKRAATIRVGKVMLTQLCLFTITEQVDTQIAFRN